MRTPCAESTATRWIYNARHLAEGDAARTRPLDGNIRDGNCRHKHLSIGVQGLCKQRRVVRQFYDTTHVHNRDSVGNVPNDGKIIDDIRQYD